MDTRAAAIVDARWLRERLAGGGPRPIVVHTGFSHEGLREYRSAHIPGAIHLDTDALEDDYPSWHLRADAPLRHALGAHGIDPAATVVVYGARSIAAARTWWVLLYAGVSEVRLLDGGLDAWRAAGGSVERRASTLAPRVFGAVPRHELNIHTAELRHAHREVQLADVRSLEEFAGASSGYQHLRFAGRIPGAIALGDADDEAHIYQHRDGRLRAPAEIDARWRAAGIDRARELVFYCGTGWRSSLAFLYAWELGYRRVRNYSDGWAGWSTRHVRDAVAGKPTPGWRHLRTGNPVECDDDPLALTG